MIKLKKHRFHFIVWMQCVHLFVVSCVTQPEKSTQPPSSAAGRKETSLESPIPDPKITKKPENASEALTSIYTGVEDAEKALAVLEQADVLSMDQESRYIYALLLQETGRIDDARNQLESLTKEYPDMAQAWYQLALLEHVDNNADSRDAALKIALETNPEMVEAWAFQGEVAAKAKKWKQARDGYEKALKLDPGNTNALAGLAWVYAVNQEPENALILLDKALTIDPEDAYNWVDRYRINIALSQYGEAAKDIDRAIELDPDVSWHYLDRARLRLTYLQNYKGALSDLNTVERLTPDNFFAQVYLGGLHDLLRNFSQSEKYYKKVLDARTDYIWAYLPLAKFAWMRGKYNEAYDLFTKAADVESNDFSIKLMAALSLLKMNKKADYKKEISAVLKPLKRGTSMYEVVRFCMQPQSDFYAINALNNETDKKLRDQLWFYMGVIYEIEGAAAASRAVYEQINVNHGKMEYDMAWAAVNGMGD